MGFVLSIIAQLLFIALFPINRIVRMVMQIRSYAFFRTINDYEFKHALDLDIFGNYAYQETFNLLLKKRKSNISFGRKGETISSVLGKSQFANQLTWLGWFVVGLLYILDFKYWNKGGHCLNSIMKDKEIRLWFDTAFTKSK